MAMAQMQEILHFEGDIALYCSIVQAKSIPSFIDLTLIYFLASAHKLHISLGGTILTISNQFTLSSSLATQNALSGHFLVLLPSIISRNSSGVRFISHRHCLSIFLCSSVSSIFPMIYI